VGAWLREVVKEIPTHSPRDFVDDNSERMLHSIQ
jgi:hypothetical protein